MTDYFTTTIRLQNILYLTAAFKLALETFRFKTTFDRDDLIAEPVKSGHWLTPSTSGEDNPAKDAIVGNQSTTWMSLRERVKLLNQHRHFLILYYIKNSRHIIHQRVEWLNKKCSHARILGAVFVVKYKSVIKYVVRSFKEN